MLNNKNVTMNAKSVVATSENETVLCELIAVIKPEEDDVRFFVRPVDKEASRAYRQIVREDRAEFEDAAYALLDELKNA